MKTNTQERVSLEARLERKAIASYKEARQHDFDDHNDWDDEIMDNASQALINAIWMTNHRFYK